MTPPITLEQLLVLVRYALQLGSGYAIGRGLMTAETALALSGLVTSLVTLLWGLYARRPAALVAAATRVEGHQESLLDPKLAAAAVKAGAVNVVPEAA